MNYVFNNHSMRNDAMTLKIDLYSINMKSIFLQCNNRTPL